MAIDRQAPAAISADATNGNRLLTAQTGAILIVLLLVLGVTILRIGQLLSVHMFVGILLIPPVALKLASTGYRFARYYTKDPSYRRAGPPAPALRGIAPIVVLSTIAVFATGVVLLFVGPQSSLRGTLQPLHKDAFIVWVVFMALHVAGHIAEIPGALDPRYEGRLTALASEITESLPGMRRSAAIAEPREWDAHGTGRAGRMLSLSGVVVAGIVLALVSLSWFGPWLHHAQTFVIRGG